jgi:hypothetical protein
MRYTYPHVEHFDGPAETIRFISNILRARDVVAFAPLDDNALILSATVEPSLLNLLLMKPADHDFASRIAHLLAGLDVHGVILLGVLISDSGTGGTGGIPGGTALAGLLFGFCCSF